MQNSEVRIQKSELKPVADCHPDSASASENGEMSLPAGKVRLADGRVIDRVDCCYKLQPHNGYDSFQRATDGTIYHKDEKGTLRRATPKVKNKKLRKKNSESENNEGVK